MKFDKKFLVLFLIGYFILQLFLVYPDIYRPDEGTHVLIGLFFRDGIRNLQNFHSFSDFTSFATDFIVKYPKVTPTYPPLYHLLLAGLLFITQSMLLLKMFNLLITILTAFLVYKLAFEFIRNKNIAILSSIFFLTFSSIFHFTSMIMMDVFQILTFLLVLYYYLKIRNQKVFNFKQIFLLSALLTMAFLTKFFSIFLLPILLLDSFLKSKRLFKYTILSILISVALISPYLFFYIKFGLYKLAISIATTPFGNRFVYFDVFSNFGVFIGLVVALSVVWYFLENYRNPLITGWLVVPLLVLLSFPDNVVRFSFFIFPLYAIATAVMINKTNRIKTKKPRKVIFIIIVFLIALQLVHNVYLEYATTKYSVENIIKSIKKSGNILIVSEKPVYSSVYILYSYLNNLDGNVIRPCILNAYDLNKEFLNDWEIKYIIDQENKIDVEKERYLQLKLIDTKPIGDTTVRIFETEVEEKVDCNYVCILQGKVCKDQGFSRVLELIRDVGSAKSD